MSEFLDFLKHKFAYVAIGEFQPGKFLEAEHLFEQAPVTSFYEVCSEIEASKES
ncbi:hypothetical protein IQ249_15415 [Lusitaniella coriacea LEGE 07157]|uniref:Uncharacterized protein n=1 Tax=Lusitaniella coriacea LEGE 07157 TaxID=945747 RepID=A0A8J7J407_9CYAN|nr:hypothetical protein [Lusitaniella coriacea]MBE9117289.1 hypothetical protein [Lusitaniella coriacea LEGE 07157]